MTALSRTTMGDVARAAGVSTAAVSYALNGLPGVSLQTRQRIVEIAQRLEFSPHSAARALKGGLAYAVGLTHIGSGGGSGVKSAYLDSLGEGIQDNLSAAGYALLQQRVADFEAANDVHRRWWRERRVDGYLLTNITAEDPRIATLGDLGCPVVVLGDPAGTGPLSAAWSDDRGALRQVLRYLTGLGHRRVMRVGGDPHLLHCCLRAQALAEAQSDFALEAAETVAAGWSVEAAMLATRQVLARQSAERPTAIVYDTDVMAIGALMVAGDMGIGVPDELSIVAWEDAPLLSLVTPQITALTRDIRGYGAHAAAMLLAQLRGEPIPDGGAVAQSTLTVRGSTAAPATRTMT